MKGSCVIVTPDNVQVATLNSGEYFGEIALVFGGERTATVRGHTYCVLARLAKTDFDQILMSFPSERERIVRVAHERSRLAPNSRRNSSTGCTPSGPVHAFTPDFPIVNEDTRAEIDDTSDSSSAWRSGQDPGSTGTSIWSPQGNTRK